MKIAKEELLAVIDLWPLSAAQHAEIRACVEREPLNGGAWLFRFYGKRASQVHALECEFADTVGARHAIAVNSGTSALIAALAALGIGPGDDVLVPAYTFIATACAVIMVGAVPNIVEVDESLTMDIEDAERKITSRTRAIVPVHMRGRPARMDAVLALARARGLQVVEDAAQACGGRYHGRWLGTFGDLGCFSFGQYKLVSAGEGGMVVTNDDHLAMRVRSYHDTAACWRPKRYAPQRLPGELFPGENFRMSEIHGTIARVQLQKLPNYLLTLRTFRRALCEMIETSPAPPLTLAPDHDPAGDVGEWVALLAPTPELAIDTMRRLVDAGLESDWILHGRAFRDWHLARFWDHLIDRSTVSRINHPYSCYPSGSLEYSADSWPESQRVLERVLMLHVPGLLTTRTPDDVGRALRDAARHAAACELPAT